MGNHMHIQVRARAGYLSIVQSLFGWIMRDNMEKIDMDLITGLRLEEKEMITGELRRVNQITRRKVLWSGETGPEDKWKVVAIKI